LNFKKITPLGVIFSVWKLEGKISIRSRRWSRRSRGRSSGRSRGRRLRLDRRSRRKSRRLRVERNIRGRWNDIGSRGKV